MIKTYDRTYNYSKEQIKAVPAANPKVKEKAGGDVFVKCISCIPTSNGRSKEELRINYLHGVLNRQVEDPRFGHLLKVGPTQLMSSGNNQTSGQQPHSAVPAPSNQNPITSQRFLSAYQNRLQQNSQNPTASNPFGFQNTAFGNVNSNNQSNNPFNNISQPSNPQMGLFDTPALKRETTFGKGPTQSNNSNTLPTFGGAKSANTQATNSPMTMSFGSGSTNSTLFGNNSQSTSPGANVGPWQATNTPVKPFSSLPQNPPSFGQIGQSQNSGNTFQQQNPNNLAQNSTSGFVSQTTNAFQPQFQSVAQFPQNNLPSFGTSGGIGAPSQHSQQQTQPSGQQQLNPISNVQNSSQQNNFSSANSNIQDLIKGKFNAWNALCLDPKFQYGTNEQGRAYVKSVIQRIIDEGILSEENASKMIMEVYRRVYGAEDFEKMIQSRKAELLGDVSPFERHRAHRVNETLRKELFDQEREDSVLDNFSDRDITADLFKNNTNRPCRLERTFVHVKRSDPQLRLKIVPKEEQPSQRNEPLTEKEIQKITVGLKKLRKEVRQELAAKQSELPNLGHFEIEPPLSILRTYTRERLLSVPRVRIWNEWGSLKFKSPVCLLNKDIPEILEIDRTEVVIKDEEWQVRNAQVTFNNFANFEDLGEVEQEELENRIKLWVKNENFELIRINRESGTVCLQI